MGYCHFADTSKIADFIERTLRDTGAIQNDELDDEHPNDITSVPIMPSIIINGTLILGDDSEFLQDFTQVGGSTGVTDILGMHTERDMMVMCSSSESKEEDRSDILTE